jgi:hypothetical protein
MFLLLIRVLGAYALAHLLVDERGPYRLLERLRELAGVVETNDADAEQLNRYFDLVNGYDGTDFPDRIATSEVGMMLLCMYCTGLWTMAIMLLLTTAQFSVFSLAEFGASYGLYVLLLKVMDGIQSVFKRWQSPDA